MQRKVYFYSAESRQNSRFLKFLQSFIFPASILCQYFRSATKDTLATTGTSKKDLFLLYFKSIKDLSFWACPKYLSPLVPPREMEGRWEGHGRDTVETRYIHGGGTEGTRSGERELRFVILEKFLSEEFIHQFHCPFFLFIHDFGIDLCR